MDRDLVESAQHGDQAAFVDLIRARVDRLYAIAQRILRDVDRAEDALQDALVIAWRDLRGLRDPDGSTRGCTGSSSAFASTEVTRDSPHREPRCCRPTDRRPRRAS